MHQQASFPLFSGAHLLALFCIVAFSLMFACFPRLLRSGLSKRRVARVFAIALLLNELSWLVYSKVVLKTSAVELLPLHLCDISVIMLMLALWIPRQGFFEFVYFYGIAGTLQALLTPDLAEGFASYPTVKFFVSHGAILAGVAYLIGVMEFRPYPGSIRRVVGYGFLYLALAGVADVLMKTNYGYLASKPTERSLLDYMGPWPWYIANVVVVGIILIFILYLPFYILDRRRRHEEKSGTSIV